MLAAMAPSSFHAPCVETWCKLQRLHPRRSSAAAPSTMLWRQGTWRRWPPSSTPQLHRQMYGPDRCWAGVPWAGLQALGSPTPFHVPPCQQGDEAGSAPAPRPLHVPGVNSRDSQECTPLHLAILLGAFMEKTSTQWMLPGGPGGGGFLEKTWHPGKGELGGAAPAIDAGECHPMSGMPRGARYPRPLERLLRAGRLEAVQALLDAGASLSMGCEGSPPLIMAACMGSHATQQRFALAVTSMLLDAGAVPFERRASGAGFRVVFWRGTGFGGSESPAWSARLKQRWCGRGGWCWV